VLAAVAPEDEPAFREAVVRAADAVVCLVQEGAAVAMNRFNGRIPPAPAEGPPA